ncbi:MAG: terminase small subunit [Candidatus Hydrogenedentes bacterium]|nr:terminase small subunit [Candidatus Hydrogenedentota bacterium]
MSNLTQKQAVFVAAYLETGCKVSAYRKAYDCRRMNDRTVTRKAQEVASLPQVAKLIRQQQDDALARCNVTLENTLKGLAAIAYTQITEFVEWEDGKTTIKPSHALASHQRAAIKEIVITPDGSVSVKLHDKLRALECLGKHLGMFEKARPELAQPLFNIVMSAPNTPEPK